MSIRRQHLPKRAFNLERASYCHRSAPVSRRHPLGRGSYRWILNTALVLAVSLTVGACTDRPETEEMVADTAGVVARDTAGEMGARSDTIEVELVAFEIEMPEEIQAGTRVFSITNDGEIQHAFVIEGQGTQWSARDINPDETETLTAELQPGTYAVYCPVSDHRQEGMETSLTVVPD